VGAFASTRRRLIDVSGYPADTEVCGRPRLRRHRAIIGQNNSSRYRLFEVRIGYGGWRDFETAGAL
jgi:hypothetical protein